MKRQASTLLLAVDKPIKKRKSAPVTAVDRTLSRRISKIEREVELKYANTFQGITTLPVETAAPIWSAVCVNTSTLGASSVNNRTGTKCNMKKLEVRMSFHQTTLNITDNRIRLIVFWYKNANTALASAGLVFDLAPVTAPTYANRNFEYQDSIQMIYDKTLEMKPLDWNGTTTTIGDQISINKTWNLRNKKTRYITGNGAGTYADIVDNSLWVAAMTSANSGAAGVNNPNWIINARCFYSDA